MTTNPPEPALIVSDDDLSRASRELRGAGTDLHGAWVTVPDTGPSGAATAAALVDLTTLSEQVADYSIESADALDLTRDWALRTDASAELLFQYPEWGVW
jgi:hypothetical protein